MEENKSEMQEMPEKGKKATNSLLPLIIICLILVVGFAAFVSVKDIIAVPTAGTTEAIIAADTGDVDLQEEFAETSTSLEIDFDKLKASHDVNEVVFKAGEQEIKWGDYYYFLESLMAENISYLPADVDFEETIAELGMSYNDFFASAAEDSLEYYAAMYQMPKDNGITEDMVKEDQKQLEDTYLQNYQLETMEELYTMLEEEFGVSKDVFNLINNASLYSNKLFAKTYGENYENVDEEKALELIADEGYMCVQHILLSNFDMNTYESLDDESYATKKAKAQELADELNKITDDKKRAEKFEELAETYNEDGSSKYCFTEGTMVQEFEDAAKELDEYQIKVVETQYGTHIIMKLPLDADTTLADTSMTAKETLANQEFLEMMDNYREEMESERQNNFEVPNFNEYKK